MRGAWLLVCGVASGFQAPGAPRRLKWRLRVSEEPSSPSSPPSSPSPPPPTQALDPMLEAEIDVSLRRDIERFRTMAPADDRKESSIADAAVNFLAVILSINFVLIVALFVWFLYGCVNFLFLENDVPILAVKKAFDPFILPVLSTHMGLTFLSYFLEKATEE